MSFLDRMAGAVSEVNALKEAFNRGESPICPSTDIYAVCDLVKSWFRSLPQGVIPQSSYHEAIAAVSECPQLFLILGLISTMQSMKI
jgi:GTPase-activating protein BEM2